VLLGKSRHAGEAGSVVEAGVRTVGDCIEGLLRTDRAGVMSENAPDTAHVDENDPAARGLWFANVYDFTVNYLMPNWIRRISKENRWCRQWWRHAEAHARLDALWRS